MTGYTERQKAERNGALREREAIRQLVCDMEGGKFVDRNRLLRAIAKRAE